MKERPILFSAPMVRALLDGSKTQTRRVVKPRDLEWMNEHQGLREPDNAIRCPYGRPGDRLWVRETHSIGPRPGVVLEEGEDAGDLRWPMVTYKADGAMQPCNQRWRGVFEKSRPSIHMPRWASRIDLDVTAVRVERLQDISADDCFAEGIQLRVEVPAKVQYSRLWEEINGAGSWAANPWVWVIEFRRIKP